MIHTGDFIFRHKYIRHVLWTKGCQFCYICRWWYIIFCDRNVDVLLSKLQIYALKVPECFSSKCDLIYSSNDKNKKIELNGEVTNNTQVQKLLVSHIDYKLKIDTQVETLYKKVENKLHALARVITYISKNHDSFCPLILLVP